MEYEVVGANGRGSQVFSTAEDALSYVLWLYIMGEDCVVYEVEIVDGKVRRRPKD